MDRTVVPCGTCQACCIGTAVVVHKHLGDDPDEYETTLENGYRILKRVEDRCIYLAKDGCTIWDRAPAVCREFDCRSAYQLGLPVRPEMLMAGKVRILETTHAH